MFNRDGVLVRMRVPDASELGEGVEWLGNMPGTSIAKTADVMLCAERLQWMQPARGRKPAERVHPPRLFIGDYTQQMGGQGARLLRGVTRLPSIDDNGNIRCFSGYDPETYLYNDRPIHLNVPEMVSKEEALCFMKDLLYPFSEYNFKDKKEGLAVTLALIFTAMERAHLALAPSFFVRGTMPGVGKGKLVQVIMELMLGTNPPTLTWGTGEETEKRLTAVVVQTPSAFVIANANNVLIKGELIENLLTAGHGTVRPFGSNTTTLTVHLRALAIVEGNNPIIAGDMARRGLKLDILPKSAEPERASFSFDPVKYAQEHRKELLEAAFSIMKAYRQAGMPRYSELPAVGSFEEWSRKVRDLVFWLTEVDVAEGFHKNKEEDPLRQNDASLMEALLIHFWNHENPERSKAFTSTEVMHVYEEASRRRNNTSIYAPYVSASVKRICDALDAIFSGNRRTRLGAQSLGKWAQRLNGAHTNSFLLETHHDTDANSNTITVTCTDPQRLETLREVLTDRKVEDGKAMDARLADRFGTAPTDGPAAQGGDHRYS
jgi:hypothetical protein